MLNLREKLSPPAMSHFYERGRYLKSRKTQVKMSDARIKKKSRRKGFLGDAQTFTKSKAGKYICIYSWWTLKLFFLDRERLHLRFLLEPYIIDISIFVYISILDTRENSLCSSKISRKIPFWIFILKEYYQQFWNIILFLWNLFCAKRTNPSIYNCVRKVQ